MARQVLLGDLNLMNRTTYRVRTAGPQFSEDASGVGSLTCVVPILLLASTPANLWAARREIERVLKQAREAARDRLPASQRVELSIQGNDEGWTYADVRGGIISPDSWELFPDGRHAYCTIVLSCLPLLRSESVQAQNLLAAACDPENTAWTLTNITATSNSATAPDGSETAATLRETSATGNHEIRQEITKDTASETYTLSCYVKADGRDAVSLYLADSTGTNGAYVIFDVAAGYRLYPADVNGTGFSGADGSIEPVGDGWYRCILTATSNADAALRAYVQLHNGSSTSYAGDIAKGLLVWGIQVEVSDSAGLLLVPEMLPDTISAAYVIPGYSYEETEIITDYTADPNNLYSGSWAEQGMTETTGQADPSGGTGASLESENASTGFHYFSSSGTGVNTSAKATVGLYLKSHGARTAPIIAFSQTGDPSVNGTYFAVDLTDGTFGTVTTNQAGYTVDSRETIDMGGGWWWIRVTLNIGVTGTLAVRIYPNTMGSFTGTSTNGVYVWRLQIVNGATIKAPKTEETTVITVPDTEVPAVVLATGNQAGAYIWPIPGDADAIYRIELADESNDVAVNRVHIGAWQGNLSQGRPFTLLDAIDGSALSSGDPTQVGEWVAGITADDTWRSIGIVDSTCHIPPGRYDVIARVRDTSANIGAPYIRQIQSSGNVFVKMVARRSHSLDPDNRSITLSDIPQTQVGSTLVLMTQAICQIGAWGQPSSSATITNNGGLTWQTLFSDIPDNDSGRFQAWYVPNAPQSVGSSLAIQWSRTASENTATIILLEVVGAAEDPLMDVDYNYLGTRGGGGTSSGTARATPTESGGIALSAGLGWNNWAVPITIPTIDNETWVPAGSLTSGSIYFRPIPTTDDIESRWTQVVILPGQSEPQPQGWLNVLALFKAAKPSGSSIGIGQWSVVVTAITADGIESLPSERVAAQVVSSGSAVTVAWDPPENGTPAKYRIYRNRGTGWGYIDTADASATSYTFTSESGLTSGSPPTQTSTIAALRVAVSPASGKTIQVGRSTSVRRANGIWEPVALGSVTLPPVAPGESTTPDGWQLRVQARNEAAYPVECNGLWIVSADDGQVQAWRPRMNANDPQDWIVDSARDELTTAVLLDGASDAGQLALVPGVLTLRPNGGAHISVRPDIQDGVSDLVNADLRITRVLVTPRHQYLAGRRS